MKKRLLCVVIAVLMVMPMLLASCGKEDEKDKMKDIILGTDSDNPIDRAYTLSLWIPTDAITVKGMTADLSELTQQQKQDLLNKNPEVYEFLKRVDDVEEAINEVLIGNSFYTKIDIVPVNNEYYEEAVANKLTAIDNEINPGDMNIKGLDTAYENEIAEEVVGNKVIYDLLYRPVDKNQLDIFLIRDYGDYSGYEQYHSYVNKGYLLPLNEGDTKYVADGGAYASIIKLIRAPFLQEMKIDNKIYALPNNHLYADQYQYILVNKALLAENEAFDISNMKDFNSCVDFINAIGQKGEKNIVPFVGSYDDVAGYYFIDKELGFGGKVNVNEETNETTLDIESIFGSNQFNAFVNQYKELEDKGYVKNEASDDEIAAVKIFKGTSLEAQKFADDYYLIKTANPVANTDDVFASMFAISTFSLNYDRSMKILNLLQSDSKIRTLLQYGIEGEDYTKVVEVVDGEEVEKIHIKDDTYYKMNSLYTGNQYYTYPGDNTAIDDWDYVKETNLNVIVNPFIKFDYYLENSSLTDEEKTIISENREVCVQIINGIYDGISEMSLDEYLAFAKLFEEIPERIVAIKNSQEEMAENKTTIEKNQKEISSKCEALDAETKTAFVNCANEIDNIVEQIKKIEEEEKAGDYTNAILKITLIDDKDRKLAQLLEINEELANLKSEILDLEARNIELLELIATYQEECNTLLAQNDDLIQKWSSIGELFNSTTYFDMLKIYKKVLTLY